MTLMIDRRQMIATGALGLGAFALPGFASAFQGTGQGFTHNVASGEPSRDSVLLWTRYVPANGADAKLRVELAEDEGFARIAGGGEMVTGPWRDHTAKLTVTGLKPGTRYHYRFVAPDGSFSPVGRTKTLPDNIDSFRMAIFSCSNIPFGYFNAYAHAASLGDIDLAVHLGDYIYEYAPGTYPVVAEAIAGRDIMPTHEILALADYRLRYASYRADPDLQRVHQLLPMLVQWDDHESANDTWEGGAQNHQPNEGDWSVRKAAAIQAWREWMPVSDFAWGSYQVGQLATLYRTDTRLAARSKPPEISKEMRADLRLLTAFRDGAWIDPAATMMGTTQEAWLAGAMAASVKAGTRWQVVGIGTNMGEQKTPADALSWLAPDAPDYLREGMAGRMAAAKVGLPANMDNWGGYPAAKARFLKSVQGMGADTIVITGDSHNGWAFDLAQDGRPAGVEFGGHSVTSGGIESATRGVDPKKIARDLVGASSELKWADTSQRGYMVTTLTPDTATNEWVFMKTIKTRGTETGTSHKATVRRGTNRMA